MARRVSYLLDDVQRPTSTVVIKPAFLVESLSPLQLSLSFSSIKAYYFTIRFYNEVTYIHKVSPSQVVPE